MTISRSSLLQYAAFVTPILLMGLLSVHTLTSIYQDIGRHIRLGEIIWQTASVPSVNLFSYTAPDFPFINHHWLAEVLLYWGNRFIGLTGLIVGKAFIIAAAFGLALAAAWRRYLALPGVVLGVTAALILSERTDVRPEVLSFLFLSWYLFVLYRAAHTRLVWTLPFVQLLWVNSHIYFFMGPLVFVLWWAGEFAVGGPSALCSRRRWLLAALIALATLMNPHGLTGALYPLQVFGNYGYSVMENKSPFFLQAWGYPQLTSISLYVGILLTALTAVYARAHMRRHVMGLALAASTAVMALMMVRNFPLFALVMLPVGLRSLDLGGWRDRRPQMLAGALVLLALLVISVVTGQLYDQAGVGKQFGLIVPEGHQRSVDFFRAAGIRGPIFNNFDIGSYLIWKLPEEKVFIDGRPEAYPAEFIQDTYIRAQEQPEVWQRVMAQYGINAVFWNTYDITPWSRAFVPRILADPAWVLVYRDEGIIILVRDVPQNAGIIAKFRQ